MAKGVSRKRSIMSGICSLWSCRLGVVEAATTICCGVEVHNHAPMSSGLMDSVC